MASVPPDFPEPFSEVLVRLQVALKRVQECVALTEAGGAGLADADDDPASNAGAEPDRASSGVFDAIAPPLRECGQALRASGRGALALVVEACAASVAGLQASHVRRGLEGPRVVEQALRAVLQQAERPGGDDLALVAELFPVYQAVVQLSGLGSAHPADLWPGRHPLLDLPSDPFATPRRLDAEARLALEEALFNTLTQPGPQAFRAMSDLCTALGEGSGAPQAGLWKLAGAAYEAQADALLAPDIHLKRMGARLLALARASLKAETDEAALQADGADSCATGRDAGAARARALEQARAPQLGHELLFRCHSALAAAGVAGAPAVGRRLERVAVACGVPLHHPPAAAQADVQAQLPLDGTAEWQPEPAGDPASSATSATSASVSMAGADSPTTLSPLRTAAGAGAGHGPAGDEAETETEAEAPVPELVLPPEPVPEAPAPGPAPRSLAEAVPGLPSSADLDLSGWGPAAHADRVLTPDDAIKVIGTLRLEIPAFNAFLNDADEASRRLSTLLAEWSVAPVLPVPAEAAVQAFALAQGADRVGHEALAALARQLVGVLRACAAGTGPAAVAADPVWAAQTFSAVAEEIRRVLHQFAAGFLTEPSADRVQQLAQCLADPLSPAAGGPRAARSGAPNLSVQGELQSLHDLAGLQTELASALDRLAQVRPSQAAAAADLALADQHFERAWSQATDRLAAAESLVRSLLDQPRDPQP